MPTSATDLAAPSTRDGGGRPRIPRMLVAVLAVTQTVGYGVLFYAFSVLITPIAADLHTSVAAVAGAATVAILVTAVAAVPVGRWLDRHGGRALMTAGSVLGVATMIAWSQIDRLWQLYAVFLLIGAASATSLYEAAFPVVIAATPAGQRNQALLAVTIVAGFASSVFFPVTGWLLHHHGWRATLLILAAVLAATTVPGHALAVPGRRRHHATTPHRTGIHPAQALRDNNFWLLTGAFVAQGAAVSAVGALLVTFLQYHGYPATIAATVSGLLGVLSVTGRVLTSRLSRRHGITAITAVVFVVQAAGAAALARTDGTLAWAALCITAFGLGFGVATIARPAILADRYGTSRYATIAATMSIPITLAKAAAPLVAALALDDFLTWCAVACLAAAGLLYRGHRRSASVLPDHVGEVE